MSLQESDNDARLFKGHVDTLKRILVVYSHPSWPLRMSVADHIYSIQRYSRHEVYYFNAISGKIPFYLRGVNFDAIIYHTSLLSRRWDLAAFARFKPLASILAAKSHVRIALPQDEFIHTVSLEDWLLDAKVDAVCSVLQESEWNKVYPRLVAKGTRFIQVLTGYLSDEFVSLAASAVKKTPVRDIDIGYRAWRAAPWLGRHGRLKVEIAERVNELVSATKLVTDISTENRDSISGFNWLLFLARCRYVLGVEGGASIHDRDGSVKMATDEYVRAHPTASFEEIEAACFPARDGELHCCALSPRHLEACATGTAQILVEGAYNGLLKPDVHYFALKRDFSNLKDVLDGIGDEARRRMVADRAYRDIVESGIGSYRLFAASLDDLIQTACEEQVNRPRSTGISLHVNLALLRVHMKLQHWGLVAIWSVITALIKLAKLSGRQIDSSNVIMFARGVLRAGR